MRQEDFVQQLAKQEAAPKASEQNVAEEDDEQGNNVIKDQLFDDEFKDNLTKLSKDQLSILYEKFAKLRRDLQGSR